MTTLEPKKFMIAEHKFFYGHVIVAASFAIMVVIWAAYYSFGVFFKPMVNEFGWTSAATSAAFSLSAIISGLVAITMGKLTDKFGPRFVMRICAALLAIGFLLMSKVAMIWQLYLVHLCRAPCHRFLINVKGRNDLAVVSRLWSNYRHRDGGILRSSDVHGCQMV
jgi:MFS family permease